MVGKLGYYQPFFWAGGILMTIGSGLYYTLEPNSSVGSWIGYQIVAGIGTGMVIQLPAIVAQRWSTRPDMSVTVGIMMFALFVGGGFGISTGQTILNNRLIETLPTDNPDVTPAHVLTAGAAGLQRAFPNPANLPAVVTSYMIGLKAAWVWSIAMSGVAFITAFAGEWRSINKSSTDAEHPSESPSATEELKA